MYRPKCYGCQHRRNTPGSHHSRCANLEAEAVGNPHGIRNGWFFWPFNFDPIWLKSCTGFEPQSETEKQEAN